MDFYSDGALYLSLQNMQNQVQSMMIADALARQNSLLVNQLNPSLQQCFTQPYCSQPSFMASQQNCNCLWGYGVIFDEAATNLNSALRALNGAKQTQQKLSFFEKLDKVFFPENPIRDWREQREREINEKYESFVKSLKDAFRE